MISTSFVLAALLASSSIASPLPLFRYDSNQEGTSVAPATPKLSNLAGDRIFGNVLLGGKQGAAAKRAPLRFGGGGAGSGILGDFIQGGLDAASHLGAAALQDANQQDIANQEINAATGAPARRNVLEELD